MLATIIRSMSPSAAWRSRGGCVLVLMMMPAFAGCASAAGSGDTFILPPPADHDGPDVKAQPVPGVDVRPLDSGAVAPSPVDPAGPTVPHRTVAIVASAEQDLWRRALASDDPEVTKIYLLRYPAGRHLVDAKVRFRDLLAALGERRRLEWRREQG